MLRTAAASPPTAKGKAAMIVILYVLSVVIMLLGAGFSTFSAISNVQMQVWIPRSRSRPAHSLSA